MPGRGVGLSVLLTTRSHSQEVPMSGAARASASPGAQEPPLPHGASRRAGVHFPALVLRLNNLT